MPRPPNASRNLARDVGDKTYSDEANPCFCGACIRYTSNAQCVACAIDKGKTRYAGLDDAALAELKARDHARYETRLRRNRAPRRNRARRAKAIERDPLDP